MVKVGTGTPSLRDVPSTEQLGLVPKSEDLRKNVLTPDIAPLPDQQEARLLANMPGQRQAESLRLATPPSKNPFTSAQGMRVYWNAYSWQAKSQGDIPKEVAKQVQSASGFPEPTREYMQVCKKKVGDMHALLQKDYFPMKAQIDALMTGSREG